MAPRSDPPPVFAAATLRTTGALLSAQTTVARLIDNEAVEPTGQDPTVLDLLTRLDQAPQNRLRAVVLSQQLLMSPSHISRTLDRAQVAGLVERRPDPDDRRASLVALTAAGRQLLEEFAPRLEAVIERVVHQVLSAEEADTLVELLGRIETAACQPCPDGEAPDQPL